MRERRRAAGVPEEAPLTTAWYASPPPRTRRLPIRLPGERAVSASLVLALAALIAAGALFEEGAPPGRGPRRRGRPPPRRRAPRRVARFGPAVGGDRRRASVATPQPRPAEGLIPRYRILTYYGHPHDPNLGILGEFEKEDLLAKLRAEAATYEAADPSRPAIPAFEVIATVAQRDPGADGTFILDTDLETLTEYADFAEQHGILVFYDLQIGRGTVAAEIEKIRPLLLRPHVHLALDFRGDMIVGKDQLEPVPGVQLVIDADGFGAPKLKREVYDILVRDDPVEWADVKLFYKRDQPLMSATEIVGLTPPDVVIYQ